MSLSRSEADLLLRKYTGPEAPIVFVVLLSKSLAGARMHGRLSLGTDDNETRLTLTSEEDDSGLIVFPLGLCRFEYAGTLAAPPGLSDIANRRFEGVLKIISASGDRLSIYEPKSDVGTS